MIHLVSYQSEQKTQRVRYAGGVTTNVSVGPHRTTIVIESDAPLRSTKTEKPDDPLNTAFFFFSEYIEHCVIPHLTPCERESLLAALVARKLE